MAAGPSKTIKRIAAIEDDSHLVEETWKRMGRDIAAIIIIGVLVWCFCSTMRTAIEYSSTFLFEPFHSQVSTKAVQYGIVSPEEANILSKHELEIINKINPPEYAAFTLMITLVLGGLIRGAIIKHPSWTKYEGDGAGQSIQYFIDTYQQPLEGANPVKDRYESETFLGAAKRIVMTILTVGTGGSGGIEGPVIPVGENLGSGVSKLLRIFEPNDLRVLQMAGISAALCSLLNTPFAAAVFAGEIVFTDRIIYRTLFYSLIASVVAYYMNNHFLHFEPMFSVQAGYPGYSFAGYVSASVIAILVSMPTGLGLKYIFEHINKFLSFIPIGARAAFGAMCAGLISLSLWHFLAIEPRHTLGMGEETLKELIIGTDPMLEIWWILLLLVAAKLMTTGFTLMSGGSAGLLIPATFMGGLSGAGIYELLHEYAATFTFVPEIDLFIIAGIASALVSIIEVPLATMALMIELFGAHYAAPAVVATVVSHLFVKRMRLY